MTRWYFESEERWLPVKDELLSWDGTPHRHMQAVKGRAADCSLFLLQTFAKFGLAGECPVPELQTDWWLHSDREVLIECWEECLSATHPDGLWWHSLDPDREEAFRGDLLLFNMDLNVSTHAAVFMGPNLIHSVNRSRSGVCQSTYCLWWKKRITRMFRLGDLE
jgi:cell wall-associated NlpC family hydrolase